jgi:hypothetical protein
MDLTLGEETITTFRQAVERVAALAHAKLPQELHGHLERAHALVLHRHVWLDEDGRHAQVLSSDGQTWYVCNGHCTCMDATRAPEGWCKHRLSVALYKRASELLAASPAVPVDAFTGAPLADTRRDVEPPPACPEALFSACLRGTVRGIDTQLTARGQTLDEFQRNFAAVHALFDVPPARPASDAPAQTQPTPEGWCVSHAVQMSRQSNARGSWFSHKTADGWCRGKAPRA